MQGGQLLPLVSVCRTVFNVKQHRLPTFGAGRPPIEEEGEEERKRAQTNRTGSFIVWTLDSTLRNTTEGRSEFVLPAPLQKCARVTSLTLISFLVISLRFDFKAPASGGVWGTRERQPVVGRLISRSHA